MRKSKHWISSAVGALMGESHKVCMALFFAIAFVIAIGLPLLLEERLVPVIKQLAGGSGYPSWLPREIDISGISWVSLGLSVLFGGNILYTFSGWSIKTKNGTEETKRLDVVSPHTYIPRQAIFVILLAFFQITKRNISALTIFLLFLGITLELIYRYPSKTSKEAVIDKDADDMAKALANSERAK